MGEIQVQEDTVAETKVNQHFACGLSPAVLKVGFNYQASTVVAGGDLDKAR